MYTPPPPHAVSAKLPGVPGRLHNKNANISPKMRVFGGGAACRMTATTCHSKHPIWKTWVKKLYTVETQQEPEYGSDGGTTYTKSFHSLEISEMCFQNTKKVREKVFTTLTIKLPESDSSQCALWLKIDSGANGNVPPLRKLKQMYGEDALVTCKQIKPTPGLSMTSYNGHNIKCHGKLILPCKYKSSQSYDETFYVVDAPGPSVFGLPTSQRLGLISINVDTVN